MAHENDKAVARHSLFMQSLPDQHIEPILSHAVFRSYDRGETLFLQGEPCGGVHVVLDGWVKLYRIAPNGSEAVVNVFTRGESFGEAVAFRRRDYPVSAEASTACRTMMIPAEDLLQLIRRDPEACVSMIASTFAHLHSLVEQLEQLKAETGAQRVAQFLLTLCDAEDGACRVTLPYDKVLIAGRLGMKPESLSRAFSRLKPAGVKISRNHAEIADVDQLRDYVEADPADAWSRA
ncbi:Crp/Fnr family transcriptional regulator [Psychromarinibacter sp. C21-152]|uniref:Crp/Fnr family transcriptional regulator n=1 Tax=Psychromarinibacter sediminicola TaxID=3033385 RepID=A0AAE3NUN4_9RHOB|nr:Crp/Fnr family transcriptional regulator [Psychromarinibacter sediminicola]MDF0602427.1 Crp/Fnr family transcriptional regulator [Psychromarinibacter sediminicola]